MNPHLFLPFALFAGACLLSLAAQSISFSVPAVLPRGHDLGRYSPPIAISYRDLTPQPHTLKVWLLETGNHHCARTQWCERVFRFPVPDAAAASGMITVVEPMVVFDYPHFLWVARLYNSAGREVTSAEAPAKASTQAPPVLAPVGSKTGADGRELSFVVAAAGSRSAAVEYFAQSLPPESSFDRRTGEFKWVPAAPGSFAKVVFGVPALASGNCDAEAITIAIC